MPASIPRRVASTSSRSSREASPTRWVRAQSACQPSTMQPMSMLTQVAVADPAPSGRDAVDDLVVDARADRARERRMAAVALERRHRARVADHALGDLSSAPVVDARAELRGEHVEDVGQDASGAAHGGDLVGTLDRDGRLAVAERDAHQADVAALGVERVVDAAADLGDRQAAVDAGHDARAARSAPPLPPSAESASPSALGPPRGGRRRAGRVACPPGRRSPATRRRIGIDVVRGAAGRADPAAADAPDQLLGRHLDEDDAGDLLAVLGERGVERLGLPHGARKAVEDRAALPHRRARGAP